MKSKGRPKRCTFFILITRYYVPSMAPEKVEVLNRCCDSMGGDTRGNSRWGFLESNKDLFTTMCRILHRWCIPFETESRVPPGKTGDS